MPLPSIMISFVGHCKRERKGRKIKIEMGVCISGNGEKR